MAEKIALHTAEVKAGDNQSKDEASYGGYARATADEVGHVLFPNLTEGEGKYYTHASVAEDDGVIIAVMELKPASLGQKGAGPSFNVSEIL